MLRRGSMILCAVLVAGGLSAPAGRASTTRLRSYPPIRVDHPEFSQHEGALPLKGPIRASGAAAPTVGSRKRWPALDSVGGQLYLKRFKLRGKARHAEVWVANDSDAVSTNLRFPEGDCRNGDRTRVTDAQIRYLLSEFTNNIYPKESRVFSRPPNRDGSRAEAYDLGVRRGYYRGEGDNIVILVDNVRDENFYDTDNVSNIPYIAGFFHPYFNAFTGRNIMTIDGYDWIHRTRENPPHEPDPTNLCASKPARPHLVEETFAHEYQHLLEHYQDRNELTWVDEGLSTWAQLLTGYSNPWLPITEVGHDRQVQCFLGWCSTQTNANPNPTNAGPENSLTIWGDQGDSEILADYGAGFTFMQHLKSRFGTGLMSRLHRNDGNGFRGLNRTLRAIGAKQRARVLVNDWSATNALDAVVGDGAVVTGLSAESLSTRRVDAIVNWDSTDAFSTPGAPPNGADYVRLRNRQGTYLTAANINSLELTAGTLPGNVPARVRVTLQLVAFDDAHTQVWISRHRVPLGGSVSFNRAQVTAMIGDTAQTVAAIVGFDDPTETVRDFAPYSLTVNGIRQPGG